MLDLILKLNNFHKCLFTYEYISKIFLQRAEYEGINKTNSEELS